MYLWMINLRMRLMVCALSGSKKEEISQMSLLISFE